MMQNSVMMPVAMGAAMGAMMLWMFHGMMTGQTNTGAALFILGHLAVLLALAALALLGRLGKKAWGARLIRHRPSRSHVVIMLASAATSALMIHLIHGGPTWT